MSQNLDVFDFALEKEEMESFISLEKPANPDFSHRNPKLVKFLLDYDRQFNPANKK